MEFLQKKEFRKVELWNFILGLILKIVRIRFGILYMEKKLLLNGKFLMWKNI